jgi:hypothetical protein
MRRAAACALVLAVSATACRSEAPQVPRPCLEGAERVEDALRAAPGAVTLSGGVPLSLCVERAREGAPLQNLGVILTGAADRLSDRAREGDEEAALRLGYLVGAARRGAEQTLVHAELVRRLERAAALSGAPAPVGEAVQRGLRAGHERG